MLLKKIHVSGFKSFVDPTTVTIPADLTGIIGPNGCGKSNVIDAVRWVMGEGSARKLRGDSMTDVIFNGTDSRKPVGKASVELVFDNSDSSAPPAYARFGEVSIKRTLSRDGTSGYQINKARCRRRDITDLFHGTGLGPRSYSIIEQGMVSRIVEARPEDLRSFVEEAAGISHYKDRRRETETRIRHTRENLSRVGDIRRELETQLRRLQRQAQAARRYQKLKDEERVVNGQLFALRHLALQAQVDDQASRTSQAETEAQSRLANQRALEKSIEEIRASELTAQQNVSDVQGRFYAVGADVASAEQAIEYARETEQQQRSELERLESALQDITTEREQDVTEIARLKEELSRHQQERQRYATVQQAAVQAQGEQEQAFEGWQERWHEFTHSAAQPIQDQEVQRTRIEQLEAVDQKGQERLARLDEEMMALLSEEESLEVDAARTDANERAAAARECEQQVEQLSAAIQQLRTQVETLSGQVDDGRQQMHAARSRLESLQELQDAALGQDEEYRKWLQKRGLAHAPRLAGEITVADGWERAADAILGRRLTGLGVGSLDQALVDRAGLPATNLFFIESGEAAMLKSDPQTLLAHLRCPRYDLAPLLTGIYVADDLEQALARRRTLAPQECVVTRCGMVVGPNWVRVPRGQDQQEGLLEREEEIKHLHQDVSALVSRTDALEASLDDAREQVRSTEQRQHERQGALKQWFTARSEARQVLADREARFAQIEGRRQQLATEIDELMTELTITGGELGEARRHFALAEDETGALEEKRAALLAEKEQLSGALAASRRQVQEAREQLHRTELALQRAQASLDSLTASLERLATQSERMHERRGQLHQHLDRGDEPEQALQDRLEQLLGSRKQVEKELAAARDQLASLEEQVRELQGQLSEREQEVATARDALEQQRLKAQELTVRAETLQEQIQAAKYALASLLAELPEDASEPNWVERADVLAEKISRIGPVNLVAIEEFDEQSKRKEYLDTQHADLVEALDTLEGVIRKIDRETRDRFKSTFDQLNEGFTEFFPRLFGGGSAVLQLTGDDMLIAGVTVMARPPGKRNSTIHLLSGGEKALTAVALLFALFRLNPAPFCILDEVDAPLDDANVERYCQTLRVLAERSQLVVITHNKITMEAADILLGVTMVEPGVSSIVSVDVDQAVRLAAQ